MKAIAPVLPKRLEGRFRPYQKYREVRGEWTGAIPAHWEIKPVKHVCLLREDKLDVPPDDALYIGMESVASGTGKLVPGVEETAEGTVTCFSPGEVLFGKLRPYLAKSWLADNDGVCSTEFLVLRPKVVESRYLNYFLLSDGFIRTVDASTYGTRMPRAKWGFVGNLSIAYPAEREQCAIADFLDRETAKIEKLVAKKERLIELLQEKRAALITRAVTKGLDPNILMKDSGVEWLGQIPAHWESAKMWRISNAVSGGTPTKEKREYWDGDIPWVSPKDMKRRLINSSEDAITERAVVETGIKLVAPPAVLIVVRGMILAHTFPVAITTVPVTINQDMKAVRFRHGIDSLFMGWVFEGIGNSVLVVVVEEAAHGTKAIRMDQWRSVTVPIAPAAEQRGIIDFLDRETARLDALTARIRDGIDRLTEYRTALISAAVTGKIDVRDALSGESTVSTTGLGS